MLVITYYFDVAGFLRIAKIEGKLREGRRVRMKRMKMRRHVLKAGCALLIWLAAAGAFAAEKFIVFDFETQDFSPTQAQTMAELLRLELSKQPGATIVQAPQDGCKDESCIAKLLESVDCVVVGKVVVLGDETILIARAHRKDGVTPYQVPMAGVEEFLRVAPRLATALATNSSYEQQVTVASVSQEEQFAQRMIQGNYMWGLSLGFIVPMGDSFLGTDLLNSLIMQFRYEAVRWALDFDLGGFWTSQAEEGHSSAGWIFGIGASYFFNKADISPFVRGTFGIGGVTGTEEIYNEETGQNEEEEYDPWAPMFGVYAGVELFRVHKAHLITSIGYQVIAHPFDGRGAHGAAFDVSIVF